MVMMMIWGKEDYRDSAIAIAVKEERGGHAARIYSAALGYW